MQPGVRSRPRSMADVLRARGKLGPYVKGGSVALQVCLGCTTVYAAGVPQCPHCGSADWAEEGTGEAMAKISVHRGPSTTAAVVAAVVAAASEPVLDEPVLAEFAAEEPTAVSAYDQLLRAGLQDLCRDRGLPTSGTKDELVARLVADDEGGPEVAPAEPEE